MAILAIKGHAIRDNEVIRILEMMGGNNANNCCGKYDRAYYINENGYIDQDFISHIERNTKFIIFSLEEFLEKFPYKVGDKVILDKYPCVIIGMNWDCDDIIYYVKGMDFSKGVYSTDKDLQPYKEETMEKKLEQITFDIPEGYEFFGIDDNNNKVVFTKIQPKYPKTYKDCGKVVLPNSIITDKVLTSWYKCELLEKLQELLICRDAYWKIAGEEMGLGKYWKPTTETVYCISRNDNVIKCSYRGGKSNILEFPTPEMRDAFYENFKDLIEQCKELL